MSSHKPFQPSHYAATLFAVIAVLLVGMVLMVGYIQLLPREKLQQQSLAEQARLVYIPACRGNLLDREGTLLNWSQPCYSIAIRPELIRDPRDTHRRSLEKLCAATAKLALALGPEFYASRPGDAQIRRHIRQKPALPIILWENVDGDTIARWAAMRQEHPWSELLLSWQRRYDFPNTAVQLRGKAHPAPPEFNDKEPFWNYNARELAGRSGMELAADHILRGQWGSELLQTDVLSYRNKILEKQITRRGDDQRLTLHLPSQLIAQEYFQQHGYTGAAVALDMRTGEVLVMHSAPSLPLEKTTNSPQDQPGVSPELNRALAGYYPPGSTIKPLLALFAMERKMLSPRWQMQCPGYFQLTTRQKIACTHVHGQVGVVNSIASSCNTYYCTLATQLNDELLSEFAQEFGFGQRSGSTLQSQESAGIPFSPKWVQQHRRHDPNWHRGDSANFGIGQGGWIVTPMQMALATTYALTGKLLTPCYLLGEDANIRRTRNWNPIYQEIIRQGMRQCVTQGTAKFALNAADLPLLAKTGTAETGTKSRPHGWIVAAYPEQNPRFIAVVVVENGGAGSRCAAPAALKILRELSKLP